MKLKPSKYTVITIALIVIAFGLIPYCQTLRAQTNDDLPVDLLFVGYYVGPNNTGLQSELVKVDKTSLTLSIFYHEPMMIKVLPLVWSPDSRLLAIHRILVIDVATEQYSQQICILDRAGQLQRCFDEQTTSDQYRVFEQANNVSWSSDSQYIYFVAAMGGINRLVRGNVTTGVVSMVAEYSQPSDQPVQLSWSPTTLQHITAHTQYIGKEFPTTFIKKLTATGFDPVGLDGLFQEKPIFSICSQASPIHGYLTLLTENGMDEAMVVIDDQANIVFKIDHHSGLDEIRVACPSWTIDEQAIYFVGSANLALNTRIFKYNAATATLEPFFQVLSEEVKDEEQFNPHYLLALSGDYIASTGYSNSKNEDLPQINVLYPDKHTQGFLGPKYDYATDPLWIPELIPSSIPTATSTPTATPTLAPTSTAGLLRVQYYPDTGRRSITVDSLEPDFRIMNPTSSAIPLSEFKIRYYFTKEGTSPLVFNCWYTSLPLRCNNITGTFVTLPTPVTGADTYLEVGFTGTTESVPTNGSTGAWCIV